MILERWKNIVGFENYYQISNCGRVKSLARIVPMSDGRQYTVNEKILNPAWDGFYYHVVLSKNGKEFLYLVHKLVLDAFVGLCPRNMECRHLDGNSKNNRLENLCWGTREQQFVDRVKHGTIGRGEVGKTWKLHGKSREIRELYRSGNYTFSKLANMFNVSIQTIRRAVWNKHTSKRETSYGT